jgi:hypothetical protein
MPSTTPTTAITVELTPEEAAAMLKFLSTVYGKDMSPEFVMASKKFRIALTRQSRAWLAK